MDIKRNILGHIIIIADIARYPLKRGGIGQREIRLKCLCTVFKYDNSFYKKIAKILAFSLSSEHRCVKTRTGVRIE